MTAIAIRVSVYGEFENSYTEYVEEGASHDEIMETAEEFVEGRYCDEDAWDEGEVSWTVDY